MIATSLPRRGALAVGLGFAFLGVLRLAVAGRLPGLAAGILASVTLLATLAAFASPREHPYGFGLVSIATAIGLPRLGDFSLVDPWETHYAEVAREMLERHDFVSPWWANEGFFMSKPVLTFWLEAASMKLFGVETGPDAILVAGDGRLLHPEWAIRFPAFAFGVVGAYVLYYGVSRTAGRRAGFLAGLALLTMPGFALLGHQAITDMPLVAGTAAALGLLVRALDLGAIAVAVPKAPALVRTYRIELPWPRRRAPRPAIELHAGHALAALLVALVLPQALAFAALQIHADSTGLHYAADRLASGSPHACGLPSQPACTSHAIAHPALSPVVIVAVLVPLLVFVASAISDERRPARLFAIGAFLAAALAAMAKGPAGLVIPAGAVAIVFAQRVIAHPPTSRARLRPLLRAATQLELLLGLAVATLLIAPWYVAVYARNGRGFLDELVLRHMLGRTFEHLHDTNTGEDVGLLYFVRQLGWAAGPWAGLLAGAFAALPTRHEPGRRGLTRLLGAGAAILGFTLLGIMRTKFHHYVLILLPGAAIVVGLWLDDRLGEAAARRPPGADERPRALSSAILFTLAAAVALLVLRDVGTEGGARRFVQLLTYRYDRHWPTAAATTPIVGLVGLVAILSGFALASARLRRRALVAFATSTVLFVAILLDVTLARGAKDGGQRGVLTAYYEAAGPRPSRPLVAYQLNWKGENFYTANHVALFVQSGAPFESWMHRELATGDATFYFVTERGRIPTLRAELRRVTKSEPSLDVLTDESTSSEFALARARFLAGT